MEQLNDLKKMIAKGQTSNVFNELMEYMDMESFRNNKVTQSYYNKILLLSSRLESFEKESRLGVITADQKKAGCTRINYDLMNLLDDFPNSKSKKNSTKEYLPITDQQLPDEEEQFWKNTRKKNNIFFYESYRELYPNGKYTKAANKRIKEIEDIEKRDKERLERAKKVAAADSEDTKIGGLAIFLACIGGGVSFLTTGDVKFTLWTLIGVYLLMVIITALFAKNTE